MSGIEDCCVAGTKDVLADGPGQHEFRRRLGEMGVKSVTTRALEKVAASETSLREVTRLFWSALGNGNEFSVDADSESSR